MNYIDTHAHLDGEEFAQNRQEVMARAAEAGCTDIFLPAIDLQTSRHILELCGSTPHLYPMVGLHPEEVRTDWQEQLAEIKKLLPTGSAPSSTAVVPMPTDSAPSSTTVAPIAIGEVGLDFYWSREFEQEQLLAFEEQVRWSVETRLPLMIHCRKAQNEMVQILKRYAGQLPGGVFHCFTGNTLEAKELLQFPQFVLGIGGVLTFKKSHLPETLAEAVPLDRIVLETDSPYMAPVPMRGQRNEPAYVTYVIERLAQAYNKTPDEIGIITTATVRRVFFSV